MAAGLPLSEVPLISVVLPAHNEAELLQQAVCEVVDGLRERTPFFEVLIIENGSTDETLDIAKRLAHEISEVHALSLDVPDYGAALRAGFLGASGDIVVNFDVDLCDLAFLDAAKELVASPGGPAVVVGSKRLPESSDTRAWPRRLVTSVFSTVLQTAFGLRVSDTHGVKVFRREVVVELVERCRSRQDLFDTELVLRIERAGLGSAEIPGNVVEVRPARSSIIRRLPRTLLGLVRLRFALGRESHYEGAVEKGAAYPS